MRRNTKTFKREDRDEFDKKIIDIRRVSRVVAGGRRFSFRVTVIIGNKKGEVGLGLGKAADTAMAIEKATRLAKKNKIKIERTKNNSIPHETEAKFTQAWVVLRPTRPGRGLVAGSAVRTVLSLAGITDITAKIISRSKNKLNIAKATLKALESFKHEA